MSPTYTVEPDGTEVYRFAPGELETRLRAIEALGVATRELVSVTTAATAAIATWTSVLREKRLRERSRQRATDRSRRNTAGARRRPHGRPR